MTSSRRPVRPRWVWGGTLLALLGLTVVAVGIVLVSWSWSLVGAAAASLGAVLGWRAGVLRDVHSTGPLDEVGEVLHGTPRDGVEAGDTMPLSDSARQRVVQVERRRRSLEQAVRQAPRPGLTRPAGWLLLLLALVLLVSQGALYPVGRPGQTNATRALLAGVVLALAGMRLATVVGRRPRIASAVAVVVGVALVLNACLAPHGRTATVVMEALCGVLAALAGLVAGVTRRP